MKQTTNRHRTKICTLCGKAEASNSNRHQDGWHPKVLEGFQELPEGKDPKNPWCLNWKEVANDGAIPIDIIPEFQKFYKHVPKSTKGSVKGSVRGSQVGTLDFDRMKEFDTNKIQQKSAFTRRSAIQFNPRQIQSQIKTNIEPNSKIINPMNELGLQEGSDIDGEDAHKDIKEFVEDTFSKYNNVPAKIPTITSSNKKTSVGKISFGSAIEDQRRILSATTQWAAARDTIQRCWFNELPSIDGNYGLSFLLQAGELDLNCAQHQDLLFIPALATVLKAINFNNVPIAVLELYKPFLEFYVVQEPHKTEHLMWIFRLASKTKASLEWLKEADEPHLVVVEDGTALEMYFNHIEVVKLFMFYPKLYSWNYIALMRSQLDPSGQYRIPNTTTFLDILSHSSVKFFPQALPAVFEKFLNMKGGDLIQIKAAADEILKEIAEIQMEALLSSVEVALQVKSTSIIISNIKQGRSLYSKDQVLAQVLIDNQEAEEREKKRVAEEEAKKLAGEQEHQRLKELEELKRKEAQEQQLKEELRKQERLKVYRDLCVLNAVAPDEQIFLEFIAKITEIAAQLSNTITLRSNQLAIMFLLVTSQHQRTLIQLVTNFGKSLMFGLLAQYINQTHNNKVVVVVPNEVLVATQQKKYCPSASKVGDNLYNATVDIHYCTYDQFCIGAIPANTTLLVDEVDSLFFANKNIELIKNISQLPLILLNKYKLIGMTATFRGDQGKTKMLAFLHNSGTLKIADIEPERDVSKIEVFGRYKDMTNVEVRAIQLAMEKQREYPVIIILPTIADCERLTQQFQDCFIFGSGTVIDQLGALEFIYNQHQPIVLTTAEASLGQDLTSTAYVIQTLIPDSWSIFVQNAGRSNRIDPCAPLTGALICINPVLTMDSVKSGCEHLQAQAKLFAPDYLRKLEILETCAKVDATLPTFIAAFKKFKQGVSASDLYKMLSKVHKFKVALEVSGLTIYPTSTSSNEFKAPVPKQLLGKRKEPESPVREQEVSAKKPCQWQQMVPKRGGCLYEHELVGPMRAPFVAVACQQCSQKTKEQLYHCSGCKKYYCYLCHETAAQEKLAGALKDLWDDGGIYGDQVSGNAELMADVHENAELRADILQEHNVQQAKLVLEAAVQKQASSSNDEDSNDNEDEQRHHSPPQSPAAATNNANKRREQKQQDKLEVQSIKSGGSKHSKRSMKKGSVIVDESQWKKLKEQDKYRNTFYQCTNEGCSYKAKKCDRWKHTCQFRP